MASSESSLSNENEDEFESSAQRDFELASRSSVTSQRNAGLNDSTSAGYDMRKDDRYWERRRKNNEAAKRSREKRRMNDIVMEKRIVELSSENTRLRTEIERLRRLYNISESDMRIALGSSTVPSTSVASTADNDSPGPAADSNQHSSARKRRTANGDGPRRATAANGSRKSHMLVDVASNSDASSASVNDHIALTPRSISGEPILHLPTQSPAASVSASLPISSKRKSVDAKLHNAGDSHTTLQNNDLHAQQLGNSTGVSSIAAAVEQLTAANGSAQLSMPDVIAMLGMLQNIPVLQALLKGGQPQPAANSLPVLQQLAVLQQLVGLNGALLNTSPSTSSVGTAVNLPPPAGHQSVANSSPGSQRNTAALDLRCKPSQTNAAPAEGSSTAAENRILRVELDQINAQVRELKELLLQRGMSVVAPADGKRRSNANPHANIDLASDDGDVDNDNGQTAYSKRVKREVTETDDAE